MLLTPAGIARAHTEFASSMPAEQATVDTPVSEIVVAFTLPVTIVGNGFEVLDPQGNIVVPAVESDDDTVFTLVLEQPLAGGDVGVRYEVAAGDGHVLAGGFSFTVTASGSSTTTSTMAPTTTVTNVTTSSPATTIAVSSQSSSDDRDDGSSAVPFMIGVGVIVLGGAGLYAGRRFRS